MQGSNSEALVLLLRTDPASPTLLDVEAAKRVKSAERGRRETRDNSETLCVIVIRI